MIKFGLGEGIEYDLKHPQERWRELLGDLYYLSIGYSRLSQNDKWGNWTKKEIEKTSARIFDALRQIDFPFKPPARGSELYHSYYWQMYRKAQKHMKSKPPETDEKQLKEQRKKFLVTCKLPKWPARGFLRPLNAE